MVVETRSKRRASHLQRPPYPQIATHAQSASAPTSAPSSVFQSSSSLASVSSSASSYSHMNAQTSPSMLHQQTPFASAPLPSPSTGSQQQMNYFGSFAQAQQSAQQQRIPQSHQQTVAGSYLGQRGDGGGMPETAPFLKDFNLVAEAAKRAQIACLSRDLGDIGL